MSEIQEVTTIRDGQTIITEIKTLYYQAQIHAINSFIQIGQKLIELKELIPHGQWADYIKDNLDWNERKVQRFMQLAEGYSDGSAYANLITNPSFMSDLNMTNALALLAIPEDEVEVFAENVTEETTNKELADEIRKYKEENTDLSEQVVSLQSEIEKLKAGAEEGISKEDYEKVKEECDQFKVKLDKAKKKLKKEQEKKEADIAEAKQETITEVTEKVREENSEKILQMEEEIANLKNVADAAERKAKNAGDTSLLEFKVVCDQLQNTFDNAISIIEDVDLAAEEGDDKSERMAGALQRIVDYMNEVIGEESWKE